MHRVNHLAACVIAGLTLAASAAFAAPTDLAELTKSPQKFLGQPVEMVGFCVKGGRSGDVLGYECTTEAGVYVDVDDIEPEAAKKTLADCGATQSDKCRATVQFSPHSYTTSEAIESGKTVTVFNAEKATVSF
jgi:hypothetical protein